MTAAATWDSRYCEAVCPWLVTSPPRCRCQKWQVTPVAATQVAWTTHVHVRSCTWVWSTPRTWVVRCRPLPFMAAAATEQLHWRSQLVRTAALRLDRSSPERVPGNSLTTLVWNIVVWTIEDSWALYGVGRSKTWRDYFEEDVCIVTRVACTVIDNCAIGQNGTDGTSI